MPFGATPSRWCVCHFTTSAECALSNYTIWAAGFAAVEGAAWGDTRPRHRLIRLYRRDLRAEG